MDRFKIFLRFKDGISNSINHDISEILNIFITPLYLYAISCIESKTEKKFGELSFFEKIKVLPKKFQAKTDLYEENKLKQKALKLNKVFEKKQVLFYPVEPTHLKQMVPVSNELSKKDFTYVTDRIKIWKLISQNGIDCHFLDLSKKVINEQEFNIDTLNIVLEQIWKNINPVFVSNEWISFAKNLIVNKYPALESVFTELLDEVNPKKVVVGYDTTPEGRLMTVLCKKRGIESVCIQHGSIAGEPLDGEHIVDNYILYGEKVKEYLIGIGNNPQNLHIFGAPYLDDLNSSKSEKTNFIEELGLDADMKTVLIALSGPGHCTTFEHFRRIVSSIITSANALTDYNFVFKLHRKDSKSNYSKLLKGVNRKIAVIEASDKTITNDIFTWLKAVDVLITGSSTVALEAMLLKVPVLTIDYLVEYQGIDFIEEGCTFHVDKESMLVYVLSGILNQMDGVSYSRIQNNAKEYINKYFYQTDISASKRIADWLIAD